MNPTCGECREEIHEHASTCSRYPLNNVIARLKERAEKAEAERDAAQMGQRLGLSLRREVEAERDKLAAELEEAKAGLDRARKLVAEAWSGEGQGEQKPVSKVWLVRDPGEPWDGPYVMHRADDPAPVVPTGEPAACRDEAARALIDAIASPKGRDFASAWERATMLFGRFGATPGFPSFWSVDLGDHFRCFAGETPARICSRENGGAPVTPLYAAPVVAERKRVTTGWLVRGDGILQAFGTDEKDMANRWRASMGKTRLFRLVRVSR